MAVAIPTNGITTPIASPNQPNFRCTFTLRVHC
jgi:hypothetical protein